MAKHGSSVLTIDLGAVVANWRLLADRAAPAVTAAAIKADAYGLGVEPVARVLWDAGCRTFFVATLEEALTLRTLLAQAEICVLNGLIDGEPAFFAHHVLLPTLNDLGQVERWARLCRGAGKRLPALVHVDTGMCRLGLPPDEFDILAAEPKRLDGIECRYLMSHLACGEDPQNPMNEAQRAAFAEATARLPGPVASLAASSGIFLGSDWHFGLTRPGAALYGLAPQIDQPNPMNPVVRLQAKILQIRDVDTPQSVGYGATHRFAGPARLATLAAGYADGYPRSLSGRGTAHIGETAVPVLGRVSMDLITVDVTRVPEARPGDMVDLIGPHHDVDALAEEAGTIGYEILTSLGRRYRRQWLGGGGERA
jgi:alanine racemase